MKINGKKNLNSNNDNVDLGYSNDPMLKEKLDNLESLNEKLVLRNESFNDVCTVLIMLSILKISDLNNFKLLVDPLVRYLHELLDPNTLDLNEIHNIHYEL